MTNLFILLLKFMILVQPTTPLEFTEGEHKTVYNIIHNYSNIENECSIPYPIKRNETMVVLGATCKNPKGERYKAKIGIDMKNKIRLRTSR